MLKGDERFTDQWIEDNEKQLSKRIHYSLGYNIDNTPRSRISSRKSIFAKKETDGIQV